MLSVTVAPSPMLVPVPPAVGLPADQVLVFPGAELALATIAGVLLIGLLAALLIEIDMRRASIGAIRQRGLPAVWNRDPDPRVVHLPRSGAGGIHGRVPPRPAAGSTPLRLLR